MAHPQDLGEVGGDEDDGASCAGQAVQDAVDLRLRADVDSLRRLVEDEDVRFEGEPAADQSLLLVSARESLDSGIESRATDREAVTKRCGEALLGPRGDERPAQRRGERRYGEVLPQLKPVRFPREDGPPAGR